MLFNRGMTLIFADLSQKVQAGQKISLEDIQKILAADAAASFAIVELAAQQRRSFFQNHIEVVNLLDEHTGAPRQTGKPEPLLEISSSSDQTWLAHKIADLASNNNCPKITVDFVTAEDTNPEVVNSIQPMAALRILAGIRLAAPAKSLSLRRGRVEGLRSLQALALHLIDSLFFSRDLLAEPSSVFADLKLIADAGLLVMPKGEKDLALSYVNYLQGQGISDAQELADSLLNAQPASGLGCAGQCGCGCSSGGCGEASQ